MTFDVRLKTSFNCIINGPSGSGKTTLVQNILKLKDVLFDIPPKKVFFYYNIHQELYTEMEREGLVNEFISVAQSFPTYDEISAKVHPYESEGSLLIFDDMMTQLTPDFERVFCNLSHHENANVIMLSQNLFYRAKEYRTISLNTHYMFLMKSARDSKQISLLASQVCPGNARYIIAAYENATTKPYSYLLLDFRPDTPPAIKVRTNLFPHEFPQVTYLEK